MTEKKADYDVGFGKPPKATQFKKGQSGNPKGRPKGSRNIATILDAALNARVTVRDGDEVRSMSGLEALINSLTISAMKGNQQAIQTVLKLISEYQVAMPPPPTVPESERCGVLVVHPPMSAAETDLLFGDDNNLVEKVHAWREAVNSHNTEQSAEAYFDSLD